MTLKEFNGLNILEKFAEFSNGNPRLIEVFIIENGSKKIHWYHVYDFYVEIIYDFEGKPACIFNGFDTLEEASFWKHLKEKIKIIDW